MSIFRPEERDPLLMEIYAFFSQYDNLALLDTEDVCRMWLERIWTTRTRHRYNDMVRHLLMDHTRLVQERLAQLVRERRVKEEDERWQRKRELQREIRKTREELKGLK
jgi:hypothetical protein